MSSSSDALVSMYEIVGTVEQICVFLVTEAGSWRGGSKQAKLDLKFKFVFDWENTIWSNLRKNIHRCLCDAHSNRKFVISLMKSYLTVQPECVKYKRMCFLLGEITAQETRLCCFISRIKCRWLINHSLHLKSPSERFFRISQTLSRTSGSTGW